MERGKGKKNILKPDDMSWIHIVAEENWLPQVDSSDLHKHNPGMSPTHTFIHTQEHMHTCMYTHLTN